MKRIVRTLGLTLLSLGPLTGCYDRVDLEDASLSLVAGVDITEDHRTMSYTSIPVFSKAEKKSQELKVVANTQRQGRGKLDAFTVGSFNGRKIKVIALSKRFVQETPRLVPLHGHLFQGRKKSDHAEGGRIRRYARSAVLLPFAESADPSPHADGHDQVGFR
ncbi:hypothetical protein OMP38_33520 [Cohnella ginsengisoli]|uniref:Spore germination protein N-terminal domain-containing protein n=1 Tax=Cohnella ginsengisoli TaxID=425004 RepID=A0A9X4QRT5_9BACL|nr:hypothetical protein [Cohnella ginsengisoli]MDG0795200.1 hypothetical protein [Cohnella ginsengisoli]